MRPLPPHRTVRGVLTAAQQPTAQAYLQALEAELDGLEPEQRRDVLADVRAHIQDSLEQGRPLQQVLTALGSPQDYRAELGLPSPRTHLPAQARRRLHISAAISAAITAVFAIVGHLLAFLPWQAGTGRPQATGLADDFTLPFAIVLVTLPATLTLLSMVACSPATVATRRWASTDASRDRLSILCALVVSASTVLDFGSTGWLYVPAALLMWSAALVPIRMRRHQQFQGRTALHRRIFRVAVVTLPALLLLTAQVASGMLNNPDQPLQTVLAVAVPLLILVLAVLVALQLRPAHVAIVVLGALVMVVGLWEGSLFVLAVWWLGGLWVATGLVALVDGSRRSGS